jgi:hypothetical protein
LPRSRFDDFTDGAVRHVDGRVCVRTAGGVSIGDRNPPVLLPADDARAIVR